MSDDLVARAVQKLKGFDFYRERHRNAYLKTRPEVIALIEAVDAGMAFYGGWTGYEKAHDNTQKALDALCKAILGEQQ